MKYNQKSLLKQKKLARPITLSEFEVDPDEWVRIVNDGGFVRILTAVYR